MQDYNTYLLKFPNIWYAGFAGENGAYFKAAEGSREAPRVNFGTQPQGPAAAPAPAPAPAPTK